MSPVRIVLRGIDELCVDNSQFVSASGSIYDFNINLKLNHLSIKSLILTKQLDAGKFYDFDYDNQVIANKKYDVKRTYKKNKGYVPGIATIGDKIVYIFHPSVCQGNAGNLFKILQVFGGRVVAASPLGFQIKNQNP